MPHSKPSSQRTRNEFISNICSSTRGWVRRNAAVVCPAKGKIKGRTMSTKTKLVVGGGKRRNGIPRREKIEKYNDADKYCDEEQVHA